MVITTLPVSNHAPKKRRKRESREEDLISRLPDEILIYIVSLLPITEAARTSALSHRWEKIWMFTTGSLHFDTPMWWWNRWQNTKHLRRLWEVECPRYVQWVDRVLASHRGSTIAELRICFDLTKQFKYNIDKWIEIAMSKRVQNLELNLSPCLIHGEDPSRYTIHRHCFSRIVNRFGPSCIKSLTSLSLKFVNVKGNMLEFVLSNCPLLERMSVQNSGHLLSLKVCGSSLRLKHLEIYLCLCLESIEISSPNLTSFKYHGQTIALHLKNTPLLSDVSFTGFIRQPIDYVFPILSSYFSQLETLKLGTDLFEDTSQFPKFPTLPKLRHLTWVVHSYSRRCLLGFIFMIEACLFLHKFTLELTGLLTQPKKKVQKAVKCLNQHLKVLEIVGFGGSTADIELAMYFVESAAVPEKVIVDTRNHYIMDARWLDAPRPCDYMDEERKDALKSASKLKRRIPSGVKFIVI